MRIASLIILCAFVTGAVAPGTARADAAVDFVRNGLELEGFRPEDYHRDYEATVVVDGTTYVLSREQVIQINQAAIKDISEYRVTVFEVRERRNEGETVVIEYTYAYEGIMAGTRLFGKGEAVSVLLPGGPNGYLWLRSLQMETQSEGT